MNQLYTSILALSIIFFIMLFKPCTATRLLFIGTFGALLVLYLIQRRRQGKKKVSFSLVEKKVGHETEEEEEEPNFIEEVQKNAGLCNRPRLEGNRPQTSYLFNQPVDGQRARLLHGPNPVHVQ